MWNQYTYRVFLSRLGRGFGGEGPRAEGVGGGKPPPFQPVLTRPTKGRRILTLDSLFANTKRSQVLKSHRFFNDFGINFDIILGTLSFENPLKIDPEIEVEKKDVQKSKKSSL